MGVVSDGRLFRDFCAFAGAQVRTADIDPSYWLLASLYRQQKLDPEQALWRTWLYVTFYRLDSAEKVWAVVPRPAELPLGLLKGLPTGTERRSFRGRPELVSRHVSAMLSASGGSMTRWVESFGSGEDGWRAAQFGMRSLPYGGPWSSYKWADLLLNVHGRPLVAPDLGVGGGGESAGPIPGMVLLTGRDWKTCATSVQLQRDLLEACVRAGVPFGARRAVEASDAPGGLDQLETSLCDFNSLFKGRYYVGHDIDQQMEYLARSSASLWEARSVFADRLRGEVSGWNGVRDQLKPLYRSSRLLVNLGLIDGAA